MLEGLRTTEARLVAALIRRLLVDRRFDALGVLDRLGCRPQRITAGPASGLTLLAPFIRRTSYCNGWHEPQVGLIASLEAKEVAYVDATVLGSSEQARAGDFLVMAGGRAEVVAAQADVLAAFARQSFHVGPPGAGLPRHRRVPGGPTGGRRPDSRP